MDEWRSDRDEWLLEQADDQVDRDEWAELHGMGRTQPSLSEVMRSRAAWLRRQMTGVEGIIEEEMDDV